MSTMGFESIRVRIRARARFGGSCTITCGFETSDTCDACLCLSCRSRLARQTCSNELGLGLGLGFPQGLPSRTLHAGEHCSALRCLGVGLQSWLPTLSLRLLRVRARVSASLRVEHPHEQQVVAAVPRLGALLTKMQGSLPGAPVQLALFNQLLQLRLLGGG